MSLRPFNLIDRPDHAAPLARGVGKLLPALSGPARRRIAEMAVEMREAALNDGGCEAAHLRRAGFTATEIELAVPLARRALEAQEAGHGPTELVPAFTFDDMRALRGFNARVTSALTLRAA